MAQVYIAGDWGTTNLRLWLRRGEQTLDTRAGPGALAAQSAFESTLAALVAPWLEQHPGAPVILCGMVGSRLGWIEAPYVGCPAAAADLAAQAVRLTALGCDLRLVPGVSGPSPAGAHDVMRGEETQIIGALGLQPELAVGRRLLVLPGTHCKWAEVEGGRIVSAQTAPTGEVFGLLRAHGALALPQGGELGAPADGFFAGLARAQGEGGLIHALFETRSRRLLDGWSEPYALDFLSGLLIGAEVAGGLALFPDDGAAVTLVGDGRLTARYQAAFHRLGRTTAALSGEACALAGLGTLLSLSLEE